jgi:hypothetical protein
MIEVLRCVCACVCVCVRVCVMCVCACMCVCVDVRIKVLELANTENTNGQLCDAAVFTEIRNIRHPFGSSLCEVQERPGCHDNGGLPKDFPVSYLHHREKFPV